MTDCIDNILQDVRRLTFVFLFNVRCNICQKSSPQAYSSKLQDLPSEIHVLTFPLPNISNILQ